MTDLPASGYISTDPRSISQQKAALEAVRDVVAELPGGSAESELTLDASGAITPTRAVHTVDTYGGAAADDLENITTTNIPAGRLLLIHIEDDARVVTVKHEAGGAGQVHLRAGRDMELNKTDQYLLLLRIGTDLYEVDIMRKIACVFRAYRNTSDQSIPASTWTTVQFQTELFDFGGDYNASTYIFTAPSKGLYKFDVRAAYENVPDGCYVQISLYRGADQAYSVKYNETGSQLDIVQLALSTMIEMNAGDTAYVRAYHNNGSALNIKYLTRYTNFEARRLD